jgi:hypothetical protein
MFSIVCTVSASFHPTYLQTYIATILSANVATVANPNFEAICTAKLSTDSNSVFSTNI